MVTKGDLLSVTRTRLYSPRHTPGLWQARQCTITTPSLQWLTNCPNVLHFLMVHWITLEDKCYIFFSPHSLIPLVALLGLTLSLSLCLHLSFSPHPRFPSNNSSDTPEHQTTLDLWIFPGPPLCPTDTHLQVLPSSSSSVSHSSLHPYFLVTHVFPYLTSIFDPLYHHLLLFHTDSLSFSHSSSFLLIELHYDSFSWLIASYTAWSVHLVPRYINPSIPLYFPKLFLLHVHSILLHFTLLCPTTNAPTQ